MTEYLQGHGKSNLAGNGPFPLIIGISALTHHGKPQRNSLLSLILQKNSRFSLGNSRMSIGGAWMDTT